MFSLTDLYEYFTAEEIVSAIDNYLSIDDRVEIIHNMLEEYDINIPKDIDRWYDLHCR